MKIVCAASDTLGIHTIPYIHEHYPIDLLITQGNTGQGRTPESSQLVSFAEEQGISLYCTQTLRSEARARVASANPDVLISVAFGRKFGPKFMELFSWGGLNLHPSLLPKYRGSSPLQAAILNGDAEFGVSVQEIVQEMDAGNIVFQEKQALQGSEALESLFYTSAEMGKRLLVDALDAIEQGRYKSYPQDENAASYCSKISKKDGQIRWHDSALYITRMLRAYTPWPGCYGFVEGSRIRIIEARVCSDIHEKSNVGSMRRVGNELWVGCGSGVLGIKRLQRAGKKELAVPDFLNGNPGFCTKQFEVDISA